MKPGIATGPNRRRFLQGAAAVAGGAAFAASNSVLFKLAAFAQDPPTGCPALPSGGSAFVPGQDTRPITLRKAISALSAAEVTRLQQAYTALRALPGTDKRTWLLQADLHALYCQQCNNAPTTQIHGSWNFFPWHRAYLYYYERILGSLVGDLAGFRLPYWDWENARTMPSTYSTPAAAANSLWDANRDTTLGGGGQLPPNDGSAAQITFLDGITDFATFGGTVNGGGTCESNPHGVIHNDVGFKNSPWHDMGNLGFAARDPIFFAHHCNIDKVWSRWNDLSGGGGLPAGAYKNPTDASFLNARWSFYDENQQIVSISAGDVLEHSKNLRYVYQVPVRPTLPFRVIYECRLIYPGPGPDPGPFLAVSEDVRTQLMARSLEHTPVALVLKGVTVPSNISGTFDIFAVRGEKKTQIGSLGLIGETGMNMKERKPFTVVLDASNAVADLFAKLKPASIHAYGRRGEKGHAEAQFVIKAQSAEIRVQRP